LIRNAVFNLDREPNLEDIHKLLKIIEIRTSFIMTALDDLNAAVATLTTSISAEIAALSAAQAGNDSVGVEAAVANLNALNSQLQNSLNPAPATPTVTA
jgi:hypothetical protein